MTMYATERRPATTEDRLKLGEEFASADQKLALIEAEKEAATKVYGGRIKELRQRIRSISRQLDQGIFEDTFEVEEQPDDARQMIAVIRLDTGEEFETRPMNEAEKAASFKRTQASLPFNSDSEGVNETERMVPRRSDVVPKAGRGRQKKAAAPALASAARRPRKQA